MREPAASLRERTRRAAGASRTAGALREHGRTLLIALGAGLFMAAVGAFGSDAQPPALRAAYWITVIMAGTVMGMLTTRVVNSRGWLEERPWAHWAVTTLLVAPPVTVLVWALTRAFFGGAPGFRGVWSFFPSVLAVTAVMAGVSQLARRDPVRTHAAAPDAPPARFLDRLPLKLRGAELFAVEAEDHYLRLHTSRGSDLILMRLSDALAELEGLEGAQTHRSWWVAKGAVVDAERSDGRAVLTLKGGAKAPVSRTYARALRDAGWY